MNNITEGNGVLIVCSCGRRVRPATARNGKCPSCGKKLTGLSVTPEAPTSKRRFLGVFIVLLATTTALLSA